MPILDKIVDYLGKVDSIKDKVDTVVEIYNASTPEEIATAVAKFVAEVGVEGLTAAALRPAFAGIRLGLAISGRSYLWKALCDAIAINAGIGVGPFIDWVNGQQAGSALYYLLHIEDSAMNLPPPPSPEGANDILPNTVLPSYSPIILDLDGDGVETLGVGSGVQYDLDNNGFQETVGWAGADDGLLALDRNGDGSITGGLELFGNHTTLADGNKAANGFVALAEFDGNSDGRIDENDAVYADLRVWRDVNANGVSEAGELLTLAEAGVSRLNLANTTTIDDQGNAHRQVGSYYEATCFKLAA